MASDPKLSNAAAIAACDAIVALVDAGTPPGTIALYDDTDTVPFQADAGIDDSVLLVELDMSTTAFGAAADGNPGGTATAATISTAAALAGGTVSFFRVKDASGDTIIQGTVAESGEDADINIPELVKDGVVGCTEMALTVPEG